MKGIAITPIFRGSLYMSKTDKELMTEYRITHETKTVYSYKQHNFEQLNDAIRYAEIDINRSRKASSYLLKESDIVSSKIRDR